MFSYTQDNIDDSVNRFVDGTSGPLRDMLGQDNNIENLKALFRDTNATRKPSINGAALEKVDDDHRQRVGAGVGAGDGRPTSTATTSRRSPTGCGSSCTRTTPAT